MIKEKFLKVLTAATCITTLILPHTSVVLAAALTNQIPNDVNTTRLIATPYHEGGEESSESITGELSDDYPTQQYKYIFGGDEEHGTSIYKILQKDDKDNSTGAYLYSDAIYCLDGNNSFPRIDMDGDGDPSIEYTRTITDFFEENPSTLNLSTENYNALCWLLDNAYLRKQMTATERATQKNKIIESAFATLLNTGYADAPTVNDIKSVLTDDDIEVIQQWAIWYFTNNGEKTLQNIPFTNADNTLPTIDLKGITGNADSMETTRYSFCTTLYKYFVTEALKHKNEEFSKTTSTYPTIANKNITYTVDGDNYKVGPFKITAPSNDLKSTDYSITLTNGTSELLSTAYSIKDASGNAINKSINEIFDTDYYIYIPKSGNTIENLKLNLSYTKFGTKASVWTPGDATYQPVVLLTKEGDTVADNVTVKLETVQDLALRKYIIAVNGNEITDRTPNLDISKLVEGTSKTAEYKHKKEAVKVKNGDTVTYRIVIYNEGTEKAKVTGIVDYLPEGLEFVADNETNKKYGWTVDGTKATTEATKDTEIAQLDNANIHGIYVDIVCKIADNAASGAVLTNIAEIASDNIEDRDSTPNSISEKIASIDKATYIGDSNNKTDLSDSNYYYKGYEDDDDFEKVVVEGKAFDLSLQKFITKVNGKAVTESREPKVDTSSLKNGATDATYTQVKTPVLVQKGDIVTYTIRVYNEGEVDGYAESVADYLPAGLGYLVNYKANIENSWKLPDNLSQSALKLDSNYTNSNLKVEDFEGVKSLSEITIVPGAVKLTSTALKSGNSDNLIKAFDGSDKLSYKDIEVTCIVLSDSNLKNIAEVVDDKDKDGNDVTDRDSTPDTVNPDNYPGDDEKQDDNDYEVLTMKKFDLSLQKFITGLNDKEVKDRVPTVSFDNGKITYAHPQTPLEVNNGDTVIYTIRVYNEGEVDGYAAEIADDIPNGLVFDANNEVNKKYGWVMYDSNKNVTTDATKATEIRTDYLSKDKAAARNESALLTAFNSATGNLFYLDVQVAFKVNTKSSDSTIINTAEITKDTDKDGGEIDDIDSTPDNKKEDEDDIDKERIHVGYFDLALKKDLTKAVVTEGDSTKEIPANGNLTKVEINRKKINSTIVKFVYNVTITNEGTIPGYAKEIKDYIPEGLQFVESDNQNWKSGENGTITTEALADKLLQPGESASVEVVLRWINNESNMGLKVNVAEISKDYNDANDIDDIDSTPNNKKDGEDDIDDAPVILSISTGRAPIYFILSTGVLAIIGAGVVMIKKYVL